MLSNFSRVSLYQIVAFPRPSTVHHVDRSDQDVDFCEQASYKGHPVHSGNSKDLPLMQASAKIIVLIRAFYHYILTLLREELFARPDNSEAKSESCSMCKLWLTLFAVRLRALMKG